MSSFRTAPRPLLPTTIKSVLSLFENLIISFATLPSFVIIFGLTPSSLAIFCAFCSVSFAYFLSMLVYSLPAIMSDLSVLSTTWIRPILESYLFAKSQACRIAFSEYLEPSQQTSMFVNVFFNCFQQNVVEFNDFLGFRKRKRRECMTRHTEVCCDGLSPRIPVHMYSILCRIL